jgi:hypothetical protein
MADDLYFVGIQPTVLDFEGSSLVIGPQTVVHRDSALRKAFPTLFSPLVVHFDAPEPKAAEKKAEPKRVEPPVEKRTTHTR